MLVQFLEKSSRAILTDEDFINGVIVQHKYNGVRYINYFNDGHIVGYSRTGVVYPGLQIINDELKIMYDRIPIIDGQNIIKNEIFCNIYVDGELYLHGKSLNWISGEARKEHNLGTLEYHIYDVFNPYDKANGLEWISRDRQAFLNAWFESVPAELIPHIKRVQNFPVHNLDEIKNYAKEFVEKEDFEGAIIRKNTGIYHMEQTIITRWKF